MSQCRTVLESLDSWDRYILLLVVYSLQGRARNLEAGHETPQGDSNSGDGPHWFWQELAHKNNHSL